MKVQKDFKELLALLNANKVDYVIVGAHALAYYGAPRYTGDLDLLVRPDKENALCILQALEQFGFGSLGLTIEDFILPDKIVQLGITPVRIDILTSLTGISWQEVASHRVEGIYGNIAVYYIGKKEFIINKQAIGRNKDLADIEALT
ncbi:MAG: hypothetical protein HZA78_02395 [Candidatus Schekmanbacteria bacterium]|nr:hypothetical protein [Candidatus Schekmanbacteria bacterium]